MDVGDNEQYLVKIGGSGRLTYATNGRPALDMNRRTTVISVYCVKRHCSPTTPRHDAGNQAGSVSCSHCTRAPSTSYASVSCCTGTPSINNASFSSSHCIRHSFIYRNSCRSKPSTGYLHRYLVPYLHGLRNNLQQPSFGGPPSQLTRTLSARPPEQSSARVMRAPRLRRPPRRSEPVSGTWV